MDRIRPLVSCMAVCPPSRQVAGNKNTDSQRLVTPPAWPATERARVKVPFRARGSRPHAAPGLLMLGGVGLLSTWHAHSLIEPAPIVAPYSLGDEGRGPMAWGRSLIAVFACVALAGCAEILHPRRRLWKCRSLRRPKSSSSRPRIGYRHRVRHRHHHASSTLRRNRHPLRQCRPSRQNQPSRQHQQLCRSRSGKRAAALVAVPVFGTHKVTVRVGSK
jgi:hypothetical protein